MKAPRLSEENRVAAKQEQRAEQVRQARKRSLRDAQLAKDLSEEFIEMMEQKFGFVAMTADADTGFKAGMAYGRFTVYSELMALRTMDVGEIDV